MSLMPILTRRRELLKNQFDFKKDLLLHLPLKTDANDYSDNEFATIPNNISYADNMGVFNGTNSRIDLTDDDAFSFTDGVNDIPMGVFFSFNMPENSTTYYFIAKRDNDSNLEYQIHISTNAFGFYLYDTNSSNILRLTTDQSNVPFNQLNTVYAHYDASKSYEGMKMYLNGSPIIVRANDMVGNYNGMKNGTEHLCIGSYPWSHNVYYEGKMGNITMWKNRAIFSQEEIMELDRRVRNNIDLIK